ncbi:MAG: chorismate mutase [Phyllobacteriaceae bacterium]|nr:chorismate mutase [Phyllobacteriaceae bacterium]
MKAAAECTTMPELRVAIDALDARLVALLAERARYIDRAAELKAANGLPANIPARVEEVVAKVKAEAAAQGFDPALAEQIWRGLIAWSIAREEQRIPAIRAASGALAQAGAAR